MTPITLQLIKKPAIYGMILLFCGLPLVFFGRQTTNSENWPSAGPKIPHLECILSLSLRHVLDSRMPGMMPVALLLSCRGSRQEKRTATGIMDMGILSLLVIGTLGVPLTRMQLPSCLLDIKCSI